MDPSGLLSDEADDAVVAYLRARAPGLPATRFDASAITARVRQARQRRRRSSVVAVTGVAATYLALAVVGPLPVPGVETVSVPGSAAIRTLGGLLPAGVPGPDRRRRDVDRLAKDVLPVVERLQLSYYVPERESCRILEYPRGVYRDGECPDPEPFDAEARADYDALAGAVDRSDVAFERIFRVGAVIYIQLGDRSRQYNWEYVYLPKDATPPPTWPSEEWTQIRDDWWFHRAHAE